MKKVFLSLILAGLLVVSCKEDKRPSKNSSAPKVSENTPKLGKVNSVVYQTDQLMVKKLSDHVYVHTSFLKTEEYGKVACNGMLVLNKNEAVLFDTPTNDKASKELIDYITEEQNAKIKAVVPTHFHKDCVAGLGAFYDNNIPVYASEKTIKLMKENENSLYIGITGFEGVLVLDVGGKKVFATFFGEGHTKDNIIAYFPSGKAIFGGGLIKAIGAEKGNLEDANVNAWPKTVRKLKKKYPDIRIVIPGHGEPGGAELFDYTIHLFQ